MIRWLWRILVGKGPSALPRVGCTNDKDCLALRSPLCWDGRCRMHCSYILGGCRCEEKKDKLTREEAVLLAIVRQGDREACS